MNSQASRVYLVAQSAGGAVADHHMSSDAIAERLNRIAESMYIDHVAKDRNFDDATMRTLLATVLGCP